MTLLSVCVVSPCDVACCVVCDVVCVGVHVVSAVVSVVCVVVAVAVVVVVVWCVRCGTLKNRVCRFKTSPCVPAPRAHDETHVRLLPVHTEAV